MPEKPSVFVAIVVRPAGMGAAEARFDLSSFIANLGALRPPGTYRSPLRVEIPAHLVAQEIELRVRLKAIGGRATAHLFAWSSAFADDQATETDERWRLVKESSAATADFVTLEGVFNPFQAERE